LTSRKKRSASPNAAQNALGTNSRALSAASILGAALCVGYLIAFFRVDLDIPTMPGQTRGSLWSWLLLPDAVASTWLGDGGEFAFLDRLPIYLGAALFHLGAWAVGALALRVFRWSRGERLERLLVAHGVGLSVVSLATLFVGLAGGLQHRWYLLGPWLIAAIVAFALEFQSARAKAPVATTPRDADDWLSPHWLWMALPFVAFVILGGALPPIEFDVREYHLQAPKEFFQLGRITFLEHNVYANMPLGAEMWPLAAMSITGDWWFGALVGKTVIATLLPFTAATLYLLGRRLGSRTAGIVAALVYASFPWMIQVSMYGLIEGAVAFYVALALLVLLGRNDETESRVSAKLLAGFFAGSASACKYPALLFVVAPVVTWIAWQVRGQGMRGAVRDAAVTLLAAAVAFAPWLLKNWYFTGNPTYPLFYTLFDGATRTAENAAQWRAAHSPHGFGPAELVNAARRVLLDSPGLSPFVWPLIGVGALSLWLGERANVLVRAARTLALYAAFVFLCWWLFTHRIDRFWLAAAPALALLAGWGASRVDDRLARWTVLGVLFIGGVWSLLWAASPLAGFNRYFAPIAQLRSSPDRVDPWMLELNARGGRVLSIGEAAVFDFEAPVLYHTTFDPSWLERYGIDDSNSPDSFAGFDRLVAEHQLDYVYVDWNEIHRYRSPGNYGFDRRVTPELFQALVDSNRLLPPLPMKDGSPNQVFPIRK
jgi:hypothetical protein